MKGPASTAPRREVPEFDAVVERTAEPRARSLPGRISTAVAATSDLALRTAVASLVTATMIPLAADPMRLEVDRARLGFYRELAASGDASRFFRRPDSTPKVWVERSAPLPFGGERRKGRVELIGFHSPYVPAHPELVDDYLAHENNRRAHAQHWRHDDGPRPTIVVVHGFMGSPYWFNSAFFSLPWLFGKGYDVLLVTLPFHGTRADRGSLYSGSGLFGGGIAHLCEALGHAVFDIRILFDHLEAQGVDQIGMTGLSLGGYTTAITAAADDRLRFAIPNSAVVDFGGLIDSWFPLGAIVKQVLPRRGMDVDELTSAVAVTSALSYPCQVPKSGRFVIGGLGDRLAPPEQSVLLWEHWDRPKIHWFPGNHVIHVNRAAYLRRIVRFLDDIGFVA